MMTPESVLPLKKDLSFSELIKAIDSVDAKAFAKKTIKIGFSSNITVDPSVYFFKKHCYLKSLNCEVIYGDYNSHITNMARFAEAGVDLIVVQNLFDAIMPAFESCLESLTPETIDDLLGKFSQELRIALDQVQACKNILIDKFYFAAKQDTFKVSLQAEDVLRRFNETLEAVAQEYKNVRLMDPENIIKKIGFEKAINWRYYFMYKSFYTNEFWNEYCEQILLSTRYGQSFFYKVVILDCDNTLWGGIVGEDLISGIKLDRDSYPGNVFWRVQNELLEFQKYGVLLCLASKNNAQDVDEVIAKHSFQVLKDDHLILKKVNWNSKVQNIQELADELDLGLESFIFVDDSDFEVAAVREMLPQVTVFQVPKKIHEYPAMIGEIRELLLAGGVSADSAKKTKQYKQRALAIQEKSKHGSYEDYLKALQIKVDLKLNDKDKVVRIAELTQKSNQFNLTTQRYTEADILNFMNSDNSAVFTINVADKFGDSGLTGEVIVVKKGDVAVIDTFLISCRVIGRTIEFTFWTKVFDYFKKKGCTSIEGNFYESLKNAQVKDFYEKLGMELVESKEKSKRYTAPIDFMEKKNEKVHIEVNCDF